MNGAMKAKVQRIPSPLADVGLRRGEFAVKSAFITQGYT
jgi:hypothetical protein